MKNATKIVQDLYVGQETYPAWEDLFGWVLFSRFIWEHVREIRGERKVEYKKYINQGKRKLSLTRLIEAFKPKYVWAITPADNFLELWEDERGFAPEFRGKRKAITGLATLLMKVKDSHFFIQMDRNGRIHIIEVFPDWENRTWNWEKGESINYGKIFTV